MEIIFCEKDDKKEIDFRKEYGFKLIEIDNTIIKKTVDYRYLRDIEMEVVQKDKFNNDVFIFKRQPKFKTYFYDRKNKKQVVLKSKNNYLIVGNRNSIEEVRKVLYNKKYNRYYIKK